MDALPLAPQPDLDDYRRRARELAAAAGDERALADWAAAWLETIPPTTPFVRGSAERAFARLAEHVRAPLAPAEAERLLARAHGFAGWGEFVRVASGDPFEAAADALVDGDLATLQALLDEHPDLVGARSARVHHATLLHYVSANGVEDYRQKTPPNAVAVARALLEAGAEVDAIADTYDGSSDQTTMNLLVSSVHPHAAGLQSALVEVLLDHGAAGNGLEDNSSPLMTALTSGYGDAAETLARRGARIDNVATAAALGRADLLAQPGDRELALAWAVKFRRREVIEQLLSEGVSAAAADTTGMTALHWAAVNGMLDVVEELVRRGAPLEARSWWGGTPRSTAAYFAQQMPVPGVDYDAVIALLDRLGARTSR